MMKLFESGALDLAGCERRAEGVERLKEAFSSIPFYARGAEKDPEYWNLLYDSSVNW